MFNKILWPCLVAGLMACVGAQAQTLSIVPTAQTVNVGGPVTVDLQISGLGNGTALGAFDIDFAYDPNMLSFSSALYGTGLDVLGLGSLQLTTPGVGTVNLFELSFDSVADLTALQPGSFNLATLSFNALAGGTSSMSLSLNAVSDAFGATLPVTWQGASVTVASPAPEPESYAMMLAGLAVVLGMSMRRRQQVRRQELK